MLGHAYIVRMKQALVNVFLLSLLAVPAYSEVHDCRIRSIDIKGTRQGDTLILRAIYRAYDGSPLTQAHCPDQNPPTWGADRSVDFLDPFGFKVSLSALNPGELIVVSIATIQNPDKEFYREKRFRF